MFLLTYVKQQIGLCKVELKEKLATDDIIILLQSNNGIGKNRDDSGSSFVTKQVSDPHDS